MPPAGDVGTVSRKSFGRLVILCAIPRWSVGGYGRTARSAVSCMCRAVGIWLFTWSSLPPARIGAHIVVLGWAMHFIIVWNYQWFVAPVHRITCVVRTSDTIRFVLTKITHVLLSLHRYLPPASLFISPPPRTKLLSYKCT